MSNIMVRDLSKVIKKQPVLSNINYDFYSGQIYGIYGRNGSGKTMLLRALSGLIYPTTGEIFIDDKKLHKGLSFPSSIGVIIENTGLLPQYDAYTNLKILSKIKKVATDEDINLALKRVGLDGENRLKVKKYSLGMKQRLSIAQAIFERPEIILLDEPTNALDESGLELVRKLLLEEKERGALIIIASHNKEDLEILADHRIQMNAGTFATC
jgi:ABC-2 type transport system ATP-binding protein